MRRAARDRCSRSIAEPTGRCAQRSLTRPRAVLLAGPTALAFFSGGYFDGPRAWAGLVAWALVAVAVLAAPAPGR